MAFSKIDFFPSYCYMQVQYKNTENSTTKIQTGEKNPNEKKIQTGEIVHEEYRQEKSAKRQKQDREK